MQWLSKSCHFMHLMQNRCTGILRGEREGGREGEGDPARMEDVRGGGGQKKKIIIQIEVGKAITRNFIIFHPVSGSWILHIVILYFSFIYLFSGFHHKPLNNLGSFFLGVGGQKFSLFPASLITQSSGRRCSITPG